MIVSIGRQDSWLTFSKIDLKEFFLYEIYHWIKSVMNSIYAFSPKFVLSPISQQVKKSNKKKQHSIQYATCCRKPHPEHICDPQIYKFNFFPHFFHLFITINSMLSIIISMSVSYSFFPFKTSRVCDYSLEPEKSWRWGRGVVGALNVKGRFDGGKEGKVMSSQEHLPVWGDFS